LSRIDNCNSALAGLPQTTIASLQRVQNAAAHIQSSNSGRKSTLSQVYSSCVVTSEYAGGPSSNYICCIMHSISRGNYPEYLSSRRTAYCTICCCQPTAFRSSISIFCRLRVATLIYALSSSNVHFHTPVPSVERIAEVIRAISDFADFRRQLKIHYSSLAFDAC